MILKKGQKKPYTLNSFTFKLIYAVTSADRAVLIWFQEPKQVQKSVKKKFDQIDASRFPDPQLLSLSELKNFFMESLKAKEINATFIGRP